MAVLVNNWPFWIIFTDLDGIEYFLNVCSNWIQLFGLFYTFGAIKSKA